MKKVKSNHQRITVLVLVIAALIINNNIARAQQLGETVTAEAVKLHIVELADDKYEGRGAGYPGEEKAAHYIARLFKKAGLRPAGDMSGKKRSYFQDFNFQPMHPVKPWEVLHSRNVIGYIEGNDPVLKKEFVVIGAHYDGQGRKGQAEPFRFMPNDSIGMKDEIWNSANDNASSVAAIIEIAYAFKERKLKSERSILVIAFGAEEHGTIGSIYYVNHPSFPLNDHVAMINLEKLGRSPGKQFNTNGNANSTVWDEIIKATQSQTSTRVTTTNPYVIPESDHYAFNGARVPAIMFYTTGIAAHNPDDHSDKIDFDRVAEAARFVMQMLTALADRSQRPQYVSSPFPDLGLSAHLATNAEADAMGLKAPDGGLKVTGVIAGLPAAIGGLQPGDFIIEFANTKFIRDEPLESLQKKHMDVLAGKQGKNLQAKLIRNGKMQVLEVNLR